MRQWLRNLLTDHKGDADELPLYALLGVVCFLGLALYNHDKFDPWTFGSGFGALIAGVYGGYGLRAKLDKRDGA